MKVRGAGTPGRGLRSWICLRATSTAFSSCDGIEEIKLPKTLKSIGTKAFSNCKGLKSIVLPEGLESMGSNPFALCDNLTDISFTGPNQFYEVRDGALIQQEEHRLVSWLHMAKADGSYAVPNDIRIIGYDAFYICRDLTAVSLPDVSRHRPTHG